MNVLCMYILWFLYQWRVLNNFSKEIIRASKLVNNFLASHGTELTQRFWNPFWHVGQMTIQPANIIFLFWFRINVYLRTSRNVRENYWTNLLVELHSQRTDQSFSEVKERFPRSVLALVTISSNIENDSVLWIAR